MVNTETFLCVPQAGEYGSGRNSIRGAGFSNTDMSLLKNIEVTERIKMQFRAEFFNAFNHPSFENPRNASASGTTSLISSNFGRTCCITLATPSSATVIALGEPNRAIQFALKVTF